MAVKQLSRPRLHQGKSGMTRQQYEHDGEAVSLVSAHLEDQLMDWTKILYLNTQPTLSVTLTQPRTNNYHVYLNLPSQRTTRLHSAQAKLIWSNVHTIISQD